MLCCCDPRCTCQPKHSKTLTLNNLKKQNFNSLKKTFFKLSLAHYSTQVKLFECNFSRPRYVVCGTNWCMAGNRVCIVDGKGSIIKRYNDYPITNCCNCNSTKMTASQVAYIPTGNRSNNNSMQDCDPRDGYRPASYQLNAVNSEHPGFHQSLTYDQECRNSCRELEDDFDEDRNEDYIGGCLF